MLNQHLHLPANAVLAFYSIFVGHRNTLQIASRLLGTSENPAMPDALTAFLHENLTHFEIMADEDPEYKRMRLLQDGKCACNSWLQLESSPSFSLLGRPPCHHETRTGT
jgi:hypothetical protein